AGDRPLAGMRLLLVEDAADVQAVLRSLLELAGADVTVAGDGDDAVAHAAADRLDAVLLDLQMPRVDGLQAAQELRRQGFRGPLVAVTALAQPEDVEAVRRA